MMALKDQYTWDEFDDAFTTDEIRLSPGGSVVHETFGDEWATVFAHPVEQTLTVIDVDCDCEPDNCTPSGCCGQVLQPGRHRSSAASYVLLTSG